MKRCYNGLPVVLWALVLLLSACNDDLKTEDRFMDAVPDEDDRVEGSNPHWAWVGTFPGWIDAKLERVGFTQVEIDGVYRKVSRNARINFQETPWVSTGYYAAPGEWITLVKPARLTSKVRWQIGSWKCILPSSLLLQRYNDISASGFFTTDTMRVRNWFGGYVYILPEEPFTQPEVFLIKGAIKSPDFILGKTDPETWKDAVKKSTLPYAEIRGKHSIWTLPMSHLQKIVNPVEVLELCDDIIKNDFNILHGFKELGDALHLQPSYPVRIVRDLQLCHDKASHSGYPMVLQNDNEIVIGTESDPMRSTAAAWNFYKELGRNYQTWCWSWGTVTDVVCMLPYYASRARMLNAWPVVRDEKNESYTGTLKWEFVISDYVLSTDADKDFADKGSSKAWQKVINNNNARMMPFLQLAQKFGWRLYAYLGQCSRELGGADAAILKVLNNQARLDFFCKRVSEYANANMSPFFDAWGIKYSVSAGEDMERLPDYEGDEFWKTWEPNRIPDFQERTPSVVKLPDDNYNSLITQLDQTRWSVDSTSGVALEGKPEHVINGLYGKDDKNSYHWVSERVANRPLYSPKPWIAFDMKRLYEISEAYVVLRNNSGNARFQPKLIDIHIKKTVDDEWTYYCRLITENKAGALQKIDIEEAPIVARYVKITFVEGHGEGNDAGGVSFDEFSLGGKLCIDESENTTDTDPDFPTWN